LDVLPEVGAACCHLTVDAWLDLTRRKQVANKFRILKRVAGHGRASRHVVANQTDSMTP